MAVDLVRFDGDWKDENSQIVYSCPVASEKYFRSVWEKGIAETGLKLFKDWGSFTPNQTNEVIAELNKLMEWSNKNNHCKMRMQIEELIQVIMEESLKSNEPFYIF
ncbi:MAG: hypothetical protein NC177_00740 [Ruminococcus flavefaciens]|nr:hypothetical protein [Ruminococcus flavefaciens]